MPVHLISLPSGEELPSTEGLPNGYPFVVDGVLHVLDATAEAFVILGGGVDQMILPADLTPDVVDTYTEVLSADFATAPGTTPHVMVNLMVTHSAGAKVDVRLTWEHETQDPTFDERVFTLDCPGGQQMLIGLPVIWPEEAPSSGMHTLGVEVRFDAAGTLTVHEGSSVSVHDYVQRV